MSRELLVKRALDRQETFRNLPKYLGIIKQTIQNLDSKAEIYLFGSVAEKKHSYSSDIDILVITTLSPANVLSDLWKAGIKEPFEIHVHTAEKADLYKQRAKLTRIN